MTKLQKIYRWLRAEGVQREDARYAAVKLLPILKDRWAK